MNGRSGCQLIVHGLTNFAQEPLAHGLLNPPRLELRAGFGVPRLRVNGSPVVCGWIWRFFLGLGPLKTLFGFRVAEPGCLKSLDEFDVGGIQFERTQPRLTGFIATTLLEVGFAKMLMDHGIVR